YLFRCSAGCLRTSEVVRLRKSAMLFRRVPQCDNETFQASLRMKKPRSLGAAAQSTKPTDGTPWETHGMPSVGLLRSPSPQASLRACGVQRTPLFHSLLADSICGNNGERWTPQARRLACGDRKSTRLNSSHLAI